MNVVIVDKRGSALWIAANNRSNVDSYQVIAALDYRQPRLLIRAILEFKPNLVVFAWRGCLRNLANDYWSMRALRDADQKISIGVTIPDHVDDNDSNSRPKFHPLLFSDYFLVTSKLLYETYQESPYASRLAGILHDVPDYIYIDELNLKPRPDGPKKTIIWVGNSKWGQNHGYVDHKGLDLVMKPAFEILRQHDPEFQLIVIDSSVAYLENHRVLEKIQSADVLIQVSISEGTGLPIIEAAGLGTLVITTKVGIAQELLGGSLARLICERDSEEVAKAILSLYPIQKETKELLDGAYRDYLTECLHESIGPREILATNGSWRFQRGHRLFSIKWFLRHLRASY
jgi:glycosyltransferase involved in cell wall biosynthesis